MCDADNRQSFLCLLTTQNPLIGQVYGPMRRFSLSTPLDTRLILPTPQPISYCDRTLGLVAADVEKLSLFDTSSSSSSSSNGRLLVACAEAAWQRRRSEAGPLYEAAMKAGKEARGKMQKEETCVQSPSSMRGMTGESVESLMGDDESKDRAPMQELPREPAGGGTGEPAAIDANDRDKPERRGVATVADNEKMRAQGDSRVGEGGDSVNRGWKGGWRGLSALLLPSRGRWAVSQGV